MFAIYLSNLLRFVGLKPGLIGSAGSGDHTISWFDLHDGSRKVAIVTVTPGKIKITPAGQYSSSATFKRPLAAAVFARKLAVMPVPPGWRGIERGKEK